MGYNKKCTQYLETKVYRGSHDDIAFGFSSVNIDAEVVKDKATLIQTNRGYVDVDNIRSFKDYLALIFDDISIQTLDIKPNKEGDIFIDPNSLIPYRGKVGEKNISIKQLKKNSKKKR